MDPAPSPTLFRRASIPDQAAAALREGIRNGQLGDPLPGEHQLARRFGISRSSLRLALAQLETEGVLLRGNGRRARLNPARRAPARARPAVGVICPFSREALVLHKHPILMEMRASCANRGIRWEETFDARLAGARPEPQLRRIGDGRRSICWVLLACGAPIQRWFAASGAPTFVLGSCVPGVELPSIDVDFRAVGWHAAGRITHLGHRRIAILQPRRPLAGDLAAQDGFLAQVRRASSGISVAALTLDGPRDAWRSRIQGLVRARSGPTALFTTRVTHALGAIFHALNAGLRIPEDLSVVLGNSDALVESALPEVTRYRDVHLRQAERAVRLAEALLAGHPVPRKPTLLIPTFVAGSTLGPVPAAR